MKTTFYLIAIAVALILTTSCNSQQRSGGANESKGVNVPKTDIHEAALTGNVEIMKQHIAAGTNLNGKDPMGGSTPLITAAVFGHEEVVKVLIEAGADLNITNNDGSTALLSAAFFGRPEIVQLLIDNGADKSIRNKSGSSAYETVLGDFSDVKPIYDMFKTALGPMGLELNYENLKRIRPEIQKMLEE